MTCPSDLGDAVHGPLFLLTKYLMPKSDMYKYFTKLFACFDLALPRHDTEHGPCL